MNPFATLRRYKGMTMAVVRRQSELAQLVREHQRGVWRYLRYLGCDRTEADDLTQETFLAVFQSSFQQCSSRQTAAYLRTAARHRLLSARRRQSREPAAGLLDRAEAVWAEVAGEDGLDDYLDALKDCLQTAVNSRSREALSLRYTDNASRDRIAGQLEMTPEGVKTLLRRARGALRDCVEMKIKS
ncbi:MAG: sigma-70 family RNA polymerase sigma factor [Planctomycetes bacterium]|nr:sigma-70 family RNA polymerase sigma factor [Planctomycetota bacterium]